jgi:hypothetical protein
MSSHHREQLLGYVLGALDAADEEAVERELEINHDLAAELHRLQGCVGRFGLADEPESFDPPAGLATRTCHFVALQADQLPQPARAAFSAPPDEHVGRRRFTWADLLVAASVLVAAFALLFPALANSRFHAQMVLCQENAGQVGLALHEYASLDPMHWFPRIEREGNRSVAGVYAPMLISHGLVLDPRMLFCPSSELGVANRKQPPTIEEVDQATGELLQEYFETMGGDYGYDMGHEQNGELRPTRDQRRAGHVLLADAPRDGRPGRTTANHGGRGQNLVYEDGRVQWLPQLPTDVLSDDPFHNRAGRVAAGLDIDDAVLGASSDRPIVLPARLIKE